MKIQNFLIIAFPLIVFAFLVGAFFSMIGLDLNHVEPNIVKGWDIVGMLLFLAFIMIISFLAGIELEKSCKSH